LRAWVVVDALHEPGRDRCGALPDRDAGHVVIAVLVRAAPDAPRPADVVRRADDVVELLLLLQRVDLRRAGDRLLAQVERARAGGAVPTADLDQVSAPGVARERDVDARAGGATDGRAQRARGGLVHRDDRREEDAR